MRAPVRLAEILEPERNSFGVVRMAMAIAVLVSHSYFFVSGQPMSEPLQRWTGHSLGEHAVQVFFFLSGILVTESLLRSRGVIDFAAARVLRIFPGLLVCVLTTAVLLGPAVSHLPLTSYFTSPELPRYLLKTLFLVTGAAPLPGVFDQLPAAGLFNMSLWTLKYEVICYAGLALIAMTGLPRNTTVRTAVAVGLAVALLAALPQPSETGTYNLVEHVRYFGLYFGAGVIVSLLKQHVIVSATWTAALFAFYVATLGTAWVELGSVLFVGSATLLVSSWNLGLLRRWTNAQDLSFGVYIYAAPLQQALLQTVPGLGPLTLSIVSLALVTPLAAASWFWVEKPALGLRHRASRLVEALAAKGATVLKWPRKFGFAGRSAVEAPRLAMAVRSGRSPSRRA